ncbi:hypothetical protein FOMPIDRAFT_1052794 [Fomitopsis schrenkii]|uniref:Uncharacterized protein n=1 Tax=Fomitopsis schrenkii TaxID=2126942 RepID=S8E0K9_FOMSC|nr:hypothetical protein FOMPIDRAFT_1052794 [Fomitopsis schrenkii]
MARGGAGSLPNVYRSAARSDVDGARSAIEACTGEARQDIACIARLAQATSDRHNPVLVFMTERRLTLQSAVTVAGAPVKQTVGVFLDNELSNSAQLGVFDPCIDADVWQFVREIAS